MANIRDIARITGYSVSTISRVINNNPYVAEEKRQKVLAVMKDMNYKPNHNARMLSYGKTRNIGVILPYVNHPYFDELMSGITQAAFSCDYKVTLLPTHYNPKVERKYLDEFAAKGFDALIVTSRANPLEILLPYLSYGRIIFCENISSLSDGCVFIDRKQAISEVFTELRKKGISRLGVTLGRSAKLSSNSKITVQLAKEYFTEFTEENIFWDCLTTEDGIMAAEFFQEQGCEAIFTNGDIVAAGIKQTAKTDAFLIGRDNLLISEVLQFSTIDFHLQQCGKTAFDLAIGELKGVYSMPYTFIQRDQAN